MTRKSAGIMKVVDFHLHVGKREHWNPAIHALFKQLNPGLYEIQDEIMTPENIVGMLDGSGVDWAVVLAELSPEVTGIVTNEFVAEFCENHLDRLIPFCSVDPTEDQNPVKTLKHAIENLGMRGLKLYPTYQHFYPNAYATSQKWEKLRKLYETAETLSIPVMFHTGTSIFPNARLKYGNPMFLDDVATDFPEMPVIIVHGGRGPWFDMAFYVTRLHSNTYLEISGLPPKNLLQYFPQLEVIAEKVLFGSDWPGVLSIAENIEAIRNLDMSERAKVQILGENAIKLLKLGS
ncbi:MAG: amidohydrolase family protein [Candidatus Hermodarchaeota archaeon]